MTEPCSSCLKFLIELEKNIFSLTEENFKASSKKVLELFDSNYPCTFNTIISNIVFNAFSSQKQAFDISINFLKTLQTKEEEINQNIVKLMSIFIKRISKINTQESYYLIEKLIEQNLVDKSITKNIHSKYFAHYKTEEENQNKNHSEFEYDRNDPIEKYFLDNYKKLSKNNWELHKKYVKEGVNPNEIAKVIRYDDIENLQEISSQTNFDFNQTIEPSLYERCSFINQENVTLIDYAAFFGSVKCFKYLLVNNAKVENTGKYAVAGGNEEIIHLCEQYHSSFEGAYETAIEFHQNDIFYYIYENKLEKIQSMPKMDEDKTNDLLSLCIKKDNYEILTFLEEKGMNFNVDNINETAMNGNLYLVKYFLQNNQIPKNILHFASESGNVELVKYVVEQKGIDVNTKTIETALHIAVRNNNIEIVKLLLDKGIDVNAENFGKISLHIAVRNNNIEIVKLLLDKEGIDVNAKNWNRETALHIAVKNNNIEIVKLLLDKEGIDVNAKNGYYYNRETALHIAVKNNNIEIVKLLLDKEGIDVNAKYGRMTAIQIARQEGYTEIVNLLREKL